MNPINGTIVVADHENNRIQVFTETGTYIRQFGVKGSGNGQLNMPTGVAVDAAGNIWVADFLNSRVQKFTATGTYLSKFSTTGEPWGVAIAPNGNIWSATISDKIEAHTDAGALVLKFGKSGSGNGELSVPRGIDLDPAGNVWVSEAGNNRVQVFSPQGAFLAALALSARAPGSSPTPGTWRWRPRARCSSPTNPTTGFRGGPGEPWRRSAAGGRDQSLTQATRSRRRRAAVGRRDQGADPSRVLPPRW